MCVCVSVCVSGHKVLCEATAEVLGECKPYSLTGSLPLVKELQDEGYDLQVCQCLCLCLCLCLRLCLCLCLCLCL